MYTLIHSIPMNNKTARSRKQGVGFHNIFQIAIACMILIGISQFVQLRQLASHTKELSVSVTQLQVEHKSLVEEHQIRLEHILYES